MTPWPPAKVDRFRRGFKTYSIEALQVEHARCLRKAHAVPELEMREAWLNRAAVVEDMLGEREAVVA